MIVAFVGNFREPQSTEHDLAWTLREKLGYRVVPLQEDRTSAEQILAEGRRADCLFYVSTHGWAVAGMAGALDTLRTEGTPTIAYHLDLYLGLAGGLKDGRMKEISEGAYGHVQHFFTVDKNMADLMNANPGMPTGYYLRPGVAERHCYLGHYQAQYDHDVAFVGSGIYHAEWPWRRQLLWFLRRHYGARFAHYGLAGRGSLYDKRLNSLYASSKIIVGDSFCPGFTYPSYWSNRIYETLGRGGFLIHPRIPGLEEEFTDRKHVVLYEYDDLVGLSQLIAYYYRHEEERQAIQQAGFELVKSKYTFTQRMKELFDTLKKEGALK